MKNYLISLCFLFSLFIVFPVYSQEEAPEQAPEERKVRNSLAYIEYGGPSNGLSINIDSRVGKDRARGFGFRMGLGFFMAEDYSSYSGRDKATVISFPVGLNYVLGKAKYSSSFEFGAGMTIFSKRLWFEGISEDSSTIHLFNIPIMYRFVNKENGLSLRAGLVPVFKNFDNIKVTYALSLGYFF